MNNEPPLISLEDQRRDVFAFLMRSQGARLGLSEYSREWLLPRLRKLGFEADPEDGPTLRVRNPLNQESTRIRGETKARRAYFSATSLAEPLYRLCFGRSLCISNDFERHGRERFTELALQAFSYALEAAEVI